MSIRRIPRGNERELELRHMRVLEVLLAEHNLTRAAEILKVTQPALSKTLASLRSHFGDPLFVRVGNRMEPTAKALELQPAMRAILDQVTMLRAEQVPFDPPHSARVFSFSVVDSGLVRLLPPLIARLASAAPHVGLRVVPPDLERLETSLESGLLDFAMGSYAGLSKRIRRQRLWTVTYVCVVRRDHPRIAEKLSAAAFSAEKHVLVSASGTGHAHEQAERALEGAVPADNIICRVPSFVTAAFIASATDAIVVLPAAMAGTFVAPLGLKLLPAPVKLPRLDVSQYWHERFHREPGNRWIRALFLELFADGGAP